MVAVIVHRTVGKRILLKYQYFKVCSEVCLEKHSTESKIVRLHDSDQFIATSECVKSVDGHCVTDFYIQYFLVIVPVFAQLFCIKARVGQL